MCCTPSPQHCKSVEPDILVPSACFVKHYTLVPPSSFKVAKVCGLCCIVSYLETACAVPDTCTCSTCSTHAL